MPELTTQEQLIASYERRYTNKARAMLRTQLAPVLEAIRKGIPNPDALILSHPVEKYFADLYGEVGTNFAEISYTSLLRSVEKSIIDRWLINLRDFVRRYLGERIGGITQTSRDIVKRVLQEAELSGWSANKTMAAMRKKFGQLAKHRAVLIAQNEVLTATHAGTLIGAQAVSTTLGVEVEKIWVAKLDSRTRDAHSATNGQRRPLSEPFSVNGTQMAYPGDPAGGLKHTANCRCRLKIAIKL